MSKNAHRYTKAKGANLPEPQMSDLDFDPAQRLQSALAGRSRISGITIDPQGTYIIDDGIWVKRQNSGWRIVTSIADLPAIIPVGSQLEKLAAERLKESFSERRGARRIWPKEFLKKYVSLMQDQDRAAITFDLSLDQALSVTRSNIQPTVFKSQRKHDDKSFDNYTDFTAKQAAHWRQLAHGLYRQRANDLAFRFDKVLCQDAHRLNITPAVPDFQEDGECLIHEVMLLTNRLAAEFLTAHNLTAPFKAQSAHVGIMSVSDDFNFDVACNHLCSRLSQQVVQDGVPHIQLNSPMRYYHDYLALKVLGRKLTGQDEDPVLRDEIRRLSTTFNNAAGNMKYLLNPKWHDSWRDLSREQQGQHPFQRLDPMQKNLVYALKLKADSNHIYPNVCERELQVDRTRIYFAGINVKQASGPAIQAWAVTVDRDESLNLAAKRILLQTAQPAAPQNPVP